MLEPTDIGKVETYLKAIILLTNSDSVSDKDGKKVCDKDVLLMINCLATDLSDEMGFDATELLIESIEDNSADYFIEKSFQEAMFWKQSRKILGLSGGYTDEN